MSQWGFYFNQARCLGCKTCMMACKNWNESRRGDASFNLASDQTELVAIDTMEKGPNFINPTTGATNYEEYRKYHMKEDWRRVSTHETGMIVQKNDQTFESTFERKYISISCHHCNTPACVKACPEGIIYKEKKFGIVLVDSEKCISCGECLAACPYDAPQFFDDNFSFYSENDSKRPRMTKCTLCKDRIAEELKPACVAACWNRAIDAGPMKELREKYGGDVVSSLPRFLDDYVPSLKIHTKPNFLFKSK